MAVVVKAEGQGLGGEEGKQLEGRLLPSPDSIRGTPWTLPGPPSPVLTLGKGAWVVGNPVPKAATSLSVPSRV